MNYERRKELTALLSLSSVAMALMAATSTFLATSGKDSFLFTTSAAAAMAALAAWIAIIVSRKLKLERERRRVFLVYAREDIDAARKLAGELREKGFNPWLDVDEITPGQVWQKTVIRALEESAVALVLISKNLSKKGFVQAELDAAIKTLQERRKEISPVIPVRLDDSNVPEKLAHVQWVNLFENGGMNKLLAGLKKAIG
jgi:hypothetical protein